MAAHPTLVLADSGASTIGTEYSFQTGDRADVVLKDTIGRVIGVEIEVSQPDGARDGILQAIKYRFMLALMFRLRFSECRSLLVAYSIADSVKHLCDEYEVEHLEIDRSIVAEWNRTRQTS